MQPNTNYPLASIGFVLLVFILLPNDAMGASTSERVDTSIGYKISTWFDDIRVNYFISDPEEKAEAIAKQADKAQLAIEALASEGKPVPNDLVERVTEKRELAKEIIATEELETPVMNCLLPPCSETTKQILDRLEDVDEANQLRLLVNDFNKLRDGVKSGELTDVQVETESNRINSEVNTLKLVDENCNERIDSFSLAYSDSPYTSLQKICPILEEHSLEDAKKRLAILGSDID